MRFLNHMNETQAAALRDVRDGTMTMEQWKERHKLDGKRFARWMRNKYFRFNLGVMLREGRRIREVAVEMAANRSAGLLDEASLGKRTLTLEESHRSILLIETAVRMSRDRRRAARKRGRALMEERDLCHPDAKAEDEELTAILEADE